VESGKSAAGRKDADGCDVQKVLLVYVYLAKGGSCLTWSRCKGSLAGVHSVSQFRCVRLVVFVTFVGSGPPLTIRGIESRHQGDIAEDNLLGRIPMLSAGALLALLHSEGVSAEWYPNPTVDPSTAV
jgi:hypothetical protein